MANGAPRDEGARLGALRGSVSGLGWRVQSSDFGAQRFAGTTPCPVVLTQDAARCWDAPGPRRRALERCWRQRSTHLEQAPHSYLRPALPTGIRGSAEVEVPLSTEGIIAGSGAAEHLCHTVEQLV